MPFQETAKQYTFDDSILAGSAGIRTPKHVALDPASVTANASGEKSFDAGHFITDAGRILPAAYVTDNSGTATEITVSNAQVFVVGDVIVRLSDSAAIGTITAIDTTANVITVTANALAPIAATTGIGVASQVAIGIALTGLDLVNSAAQIGVATSVSVIGDRLPYWDSTLDAAFPEITIV